MSQVLAQSHHPLPPERAVVIDRLATGLDRIQLNWLSGYFAGLAAAQGTTAESAATRAHPTTAPQAELTIISASHTGNGRKIAERMLVAAKATGVAARLVRAGDFAPRDLVRERLLYVVISTHGDGDPPEEARALFEYLNGKRVPQLASLQYAVLALGDSSYSKFCAAGRFIDERLAKLGARRLLPRVDCDVDYELLARPWIDDALARVSEHADKDAPNAGRADRAASIALLEEPRQSVDVLATRERPRDAEVLVNQRITSRAALRDVRHIEFAIDRSLAYQPGDALGVVHENPAHAIEATLAAAKLDGDQLVERADAPRRLHEWLRDSLEITRVARPLIAHLADRGSVEARELLALQNAPALANLTRQSQVADVLARYPAEWTAATLVAALRPLAPRLYSLASSQTEVGDEAHITVAVVGSEGGGALGAASSFMAGRPTESSVKVWIERNDRFRLPTDASRDIVMIGPGTGVAPFRGFLQERAAGGASGRNWLVFGGRTLRDDFLYQTEWLAALKRGTLQRLDAAFSRDQEHKIYVQDKLRAAGRELFAWLSNGAYLYVCGDAERMAPDVHAALLDVIAENGAMNADDAREWLADVTTAGRYLRDVY